MLPTNLQKRIALISVHGDPSVEIGKEEAGGQNVYVRKVGETLAQQGWQVDMFTRRVNADQPDIFDHSPGCRTIRLTAGPKSFVGRDELFNHLPEFVNAFLEFQEQAGQPYSIAHTHYWLSAWVGMELRKQQSLKLIHTYHSLGAVKYESVDDVPPIAHTRLEVEKACLETADCIVATSPQEQDDMRSLLSEQGNIQVIPCGTDIESFGKVDYREARQSLGFDPDTKIVLYVGRFDPRKGIETLVRAIAQPQLKQHDKLQLIIVGGSRPGQSDGEERDRIEGIVDQLGVRDRTHFTGRVDHAQLPAYYAAADVCVLPSHYEPFGLVAIEAMASHTPVVASDVGGFKYTVVPEETGLLAPVQDEATFAAAIDRILSNPEWRHQLGQASRQRVEAHFSWKGVSEQLATLYLENLEALQSKEQKPSAVAQ